jgi:hypothetical protein
MATKAFTHIREAIKSNDWGVEDRTEVHALYHRLCGLSDGDWLLKEDLYAALCGPAAEQDEDAEGLPPTPEPATVSRMPPF